MFEFMRVRVMCATKLVALAVAFGAALCTEATAAIFSTGFESPNYNLGVITGQQGWTKPIGGTDGTIAVQGVGDPSVPEGLQYAKVSGAESRATKQISAPTQMELTVDLLLAYGDINLNGNSNNDNPHVYLNNLTNSFRGVGFGFYESNQAVYFAYRNGDTWTTMAQAAEDTFYRFHVDIHPTPTSATFDIEVRTLDGTTVLASATGALSRSNINVFEYLSIGTSGTGTLYVDQVNIAQPVPEPSAFVLGMCGIPMIGVLLRYRRNTCRVKKSA